MNVNNKLGALVTIALLVACQPDPVNPGNFTMGGASVCMVSFRV